MQTGEFRKAYKPLRESYVVDSDEATTKLQTAGREWSGRFSNLLDKRLDGEIMPESVAISTLTSFIHWNARHSEKIVAYLNQRLQDDDMTDDDWEKSLILLNETHFHAMSAQMATNWVRLLSGQEMSRQDVMLSRNSLAFSGISSLAVMSDAERQGAMYARDQKGRPMHNGTTLGYRLDPSFMYARSIANEADTAIVIQEPTFKNPSFIVVPAPGRYEHSRDGSMNVDFIAVDALRSQVRGIQTKVAIDQSDSLKYDPVFVTLVDGERDLGNVKPVRLPHGSNRRTTPWPGLISAHHMLSQKDVFRERSQRGRGVVLGPRERELVRQRQEARFLAGNTRPFNAQASRFVTERILHDMYAEEAA
jgi:hypothetical protein